MTDLARPRRVIRKFQDRVLMTDAEIAEGRMLEALAERKELEWRIAAADVENYYDQFPTSPDWNTLVHLLETVMPKDLMEQFRQRTQAAKSPMEPA